MDSHTTRTPTHPHTCTCTHTQTHTHNYPPLFSPPHTQPELPTLGPREKIYLLQRKASKHGNELGKTTGWIHRTVLKNKVRVFVLRVPKP